MAHIPRSYLKKTRAYLTSYLGGRSDARKPATSTCCHNEQLHSKHVPWAYNPVSMPLTTLQRLCKDNRVIVGQPQLPCQTSVKLPGVPLKIVCSVYLRILQEEVAVYAFFLYKGAVGVASLLEIVAARLQGLPIEHALIVLHRDAPCEGSFLVARGIAVVLPWVDGKILTVQAALVTGRRVSAWIRVTRPRIPLWTF